MLAGLERNYHPAGVSAKAKERKQKKTQGQHGRSKTQVQCISGGTSGKKERRSLLWDGQRGLCRSLQDLKKRKPLVGCEDLK